MSEKEKRSFSIVSSVPKALGFDDADLKANREGVLSERQRRRFHNSKAIYGLVARIGGLAFIISTAIAVVAFATRTSSQNLMTWVAYAWIISGVVTGATGFTWLRMRGDVKEEFIASTSGIIRRKKEVRRSRQGDIEEFYIYTDDLPFRFKVDDDVYDAFANYGLRGGYYTLYYLPNSKTILSAEPLENPVIVDSSSETLEPEVWDKLTGEDTEASRAQR